MSNDEQFESVNVFGESLDSCNEDPMTGFFRDGCCNTGTEDVGSHTVCIEVSRDFLEYSRFRGNDLSTPMPAFGFPGLQPGDRWCLCAGHAGGKPMNRVWHPGFTCLAPTDVLWILYLWRFYGNLPSI